jgi:hypothetical protein
MKDCCICGKPGDSEFTYQGRNYGFHAGQCMDTILAQAREGFGHAVFGSSTYGQENPLLVGPAAKFEIDYHEARWPVIEKIISGEISEADAPPHLLVAQFSGQWWWTKRPDVGEPQQEWHPGGATFEDARERALEQHPGASVQRMDPPR